MTSKPSYDQTLRGNAIRAISASDLDDKVRLTRDTAARWFAPISVAISNHRSMNWHVPKLG